MIRKRIKTYLNRFISRNLFICADKTIANYNLSCLNYVFIMSKLCIKWLDENCFLNSVVKSNISRISCFEFFAKLNKIKYNILISFKLLIFLIL